jgi:hypothetical protein
MGSLQGRAWLHHPCFFLQYRLLFALETSSSPFPNTTHMYLLRSVPKSETKIETQRDGVKDRGIRGGRGATQREVRGKKGTQRLPRSPGKFETQHCSNWAASPLTSQEFLPGAGRAG